MLTSLQEKLNKSASFPGFLNIEALADDVICVFVLSKIDREHTSSGLLSVTCVLNKCELFCTKAFDLIVTVTNNSLLQTFQNISLIHEINEIN